MLCHAKEMIVQIVLRTWIKLSHLTTCLQQVQKKYLHKYCNFGVKLTRSALYILSAQYVRPSLKHRPKKVLQLPYIQICFYFSVKIDLLYIFNIPVLYDVSLEHNVPNEFV